MVAGNTLRAGNGAARLTVLAPLLVTAVTALTSFLVTAVRVPCVQERQGAALQRHVRVDVTDTKCRVTLARCTPAHVKHVCERLGRYMADDPQDSRATLFQAREGRGDEVERAHPCETAMPHRPKTTIPSYFAFAGPSEMGDPAAECVYTTQVSTCWAALCKCEVSRVSLHGPAAAARGASRWHTPAGI